MPEKDVRYYRRLPYTRRVDIRTDAEPVYYVASIAEIPFIMVDGDTPEEAVAKLAEMFDDCVAALIDSGEAIPEPALWPGPISDDQPISLPFPAVPPTERFDVDESTVAKVGKVGEEGIAVSESPSYELAGAA